MQLLTVERENYGTAVGSNWKNSRMAGGEGGVHLGKLIRGHPYLTRCLDISLDTVEDLTFL